MRSAHPAFDSLVEDLESDPRHSELFRCLLSEHPDELIVEVLLAALRHGLVSPLEAVRMAKSGDRSARRTLAKLVSICRQRGWEPQSLVLEALEGQPH